MNDRPLTWADATRTIVAPGTPQTCFGCGETIPGGTLDVVRDEIEHNARRYWHPACADVDDEGMRDLGDCESCGARADVKLADDSTWCHDCNDAARRLGYDDDEGDE